MWVHIVDIHRDYLENNVKPLVLAVISTSLTVTSNLLTLMSDNQSNYGITYYPVTAGQISSQYKERKKKKVYLTRHRNTQHNKQTKEK